MKIQIITLFPEMFDGVFDHSMLQKARKKQLVEIELINLRNFGLGPRNQVDDTPYGGGDGMVLMAQPIADAIDFAKSKVKSRKSKVIMMTPRGEKYLQSTARRLAGDGIDIIIICGRYEGVDERVSTLVDLELSVGDYILTGGEIPAMIITDSVVRLIPGVLGGATSAEIESFSDGVTLEYPQYTRPETWKNLKVPKVLLSGNHAEIDQWRLKQSARVTKKRGAGEVKK
jgi:tRNA (guanine37-N1)-methyltransferase